VAVLLQPQLELQVVLREFTKTVLRTCPEDVLAFSREYFVEKAAQYRMSTYVLPPSDSKTYEELPSDIKEQIQAVFKRYDGDCDMSITVAELKLLMQDLGGLFGFANHEIDASTLMALLDSDGNSEVSWQEWSHACAVWLQDMQGH